MKKKSALALAIFLMGAAALYLTKSSPETAPKPADTSAKHSGSVIRMVSNSLKKAQATHKNRP